MRDPSRNTKHSNDPCDICVALVVAPHGLDGTVSAEPLSDYPHRFAPGSELTLNRADGSRTLVVVQARSHKRRLLLQFEGVNSAQAAEDLRGARLCIRRSQLPRLPEGHYYEFQIVGLRMRTEQGKDLGRVTQILRTPANEVYVSEQVLVPATHAAIARIDLEAGEIVVRGEEWAVPARPK